MTTFEITLNDHSTHLIANADAYQQEGQMTTFFRTDDGRGVIDAWSTRVASVRTGEIMVIQRTDESVAATSTSTADDSFRLAV